MKTNSKNRRFALMTKLIIPFVVLWTLTLFSCKRSDIKPTDHRVEIIEINDINAKEEVLLSDFVEKVRFIPLETSRNGFIIEISELIGSEGSLFILDRPNNCVLKYSKSGEFIGKIGGKGKGPGEYTQIVDIDVSNNKVYVLDFSGQKVLIYDAEKLSYISDFTSPPGSIGIEKSRDKFIFYCTSFSPGVAPSFYLTGENGSGLRKLIDSGYAQASIKIEGSSIFCGGGVVSRSNESALYARSKDSLYMKYQINFGKKEMPEMSLPEGYNVFGKDFNYYYRYKTYNCANTLWFDFFKTGGTIERLYGVYNKKSGQAIWGAVKNDLGYDHLPFYPTFSTSESLIGVLSPEIFNTTENQLIIPGINLPQITDNPVLVYFDLK